MFSSKVLNEDTYHNFTSPILETGGVLYVFIGVATRGSGLKTVLRKICQTVMCIKKNSKHVL